MFWHALLGIVLINTNKFWEAPVMTVFALVQAFLASMILGVVIPGLDFKIGSSPFILLRDAMRDAPIFLAQPEFIPKDGTGLNPLLQNYWMVIHPPTLFLGFALTVVPFSFCMAGGHCLVVQY
jgi:cytochrome c-type biogenesis protein CcmF